MRVVFLNSHFHKRSHLWAIFLLPHQSLGNGWCCFDQSFDFYDYEMWKIEGFFFYLFQFGGVVEVWEGLGQEMEKVGSFAHYFCLEGNHLCVGSSENKVVIFCFIGPCVLLAYLFPLPINLTWASHAFKHDFFPTWASHGFKHDFFPSLFWLE